MTRTQIGSSKKCLFRKTICWLLTCHHVGRVVVWIEWCQSHAFELFSHDISGLLKRRCRKSEVTIHCHFAASIALLCSSNVTLDAHYGNCSFTSGFSNNEANGQEPTSPPAEIRLSRELLRRLLI